MDAALDSDIELRGVPGCGGGVVVVTQQIKNDTLALI